MASSVGLTSVVGSDAAATSQIKIYSVDRTPRYGTVSPASATYDLLSSDQHRCYEWEPYNNGYVHAKGQDKAVLCPAGYQGHTSGARFGYIAAAGINYSGRVAGTEHATTNGRYYYLPSAANAGAMCVKIAGANPTKPSDGKCTARWTSSAMTALQTDPLDPDCDAGSCPMDGTCTLK
jgi:hypothetical protein